MHSPGLSRSLLLGTILASGVVACSQSPDTETVQAATATAQERGGQEEFGPYEVVADWPKPLPDGPDGVKHEGWTWGSNGAIFAETPNRIWVAMRGELPLPSGAKPWSHRAMMA